MPANKVGSTAKASLASEALAKATALIPELTAGALRTIAARKLLPESVQLLKQAGVIKVLQPGRCGGLEQSMHVHIDVVAAVARGCGSTGWCLGVYHAHAWLMGLFGEQAQADVYGSNVEAILSAVLAPRGQAKKVQGGYRLSGFWPFCSGVHHAQWVILGELVTGDEGGVVDAGVMVIPVADIAIQDDWYVTGLTGTGSNGVVVKDIFVPEHRFLSVPAAIAGKSPGAALHQSNLYFSAPVPVLALFICSAAIGVARRGLDTFKAKLPGRTVSYTFDEKQLEMPITHIQVAEAATRIDTANLILHAMVDEIEEHAVARTEMPFVRRAKARMDCAYAVRLCLEAIEPLVLASSGSGLAESSPLQMAIRDLRGINGHGLLSLPTNAEMYGRVALGLSPNSPLI
ncbi:MAG: oxidoreductase [Betaproteobacteria bacterium]|nr:oxidoreductase [Betaproteobacteria bacterium]